MLLLVQPYPPRRFVSLLYFSLAPPHPQALTFDMRCFYLFKLIIKLSCNPRDNHFLRSGNCTNSAVYSLSCPNVCGRGGALTKPTAQAPNQQTSLSVSPLHSPWTKQHIPLRSSFRSTPLFLDTPLTWRRLRVVWVVVRWGH